MGEIARTTVAEARRKVEEGKAVFVCAYESEDVCRGMMLEGGISLARISGSASHLSLKSRK